MADTRRWLLFASLLAALVAGVVLRLWNLGAQVMAGDELHAVRVALARPIADILFVYQAPDNCIPLTVFDRLVLAAGVRLSEWMVRLPVALSGAALLLIGPWWAWRRLGAGAAVAFTSLLAISPALVFYSRIARPYAPAALLGFAAVAAFDAWQRRPGWRPAAAYVASATLALWLHLGAGPLVVAPLAVGAVSLLLRRGKGAAPFVLLAGATATAFLALLLPATETLLPLAALKHGRFALAPGEAPEVAALLAGVRHPLWAIPFWLLVGAGLVRLARRDRWLAVLVGAALAGQLLGMVVLAPMGIRSAVILDRYLMPALPWALLAAAAALGLPWPGAWRRAQPAVAALAVVALAAAGPWVDPTLARSSFAHEEEFLRFTKRRPGLAAGAVPPVYPWLAGAGGGAVLEVPWHPVWRFSRSTAVYQELHRREVVVAVFGRPFGDRRLAFRNMAPGAPAGILASRARWLIVHRDVGREEAEVAPRSRKPLLRRTLRAAAAELARRLRREWGPADHVDGATWCWDLERIRRTRR